MPPRLPKSRGRLITHPSSLVPCEVPRPRDRYIPHRRTIRRTRPDPALRVDRRNRAAAFSRHGGDTMSWIRRSLLLVAVAVVLPGAVGCASFPLAFGLVPTQPWVAERMED